MVFYFGYIVTGYKLLIFHIFLYLKNKLNNNDTHNPKKPNYNFFIYYCNYILILFFYFLHVNKTWQMANYDLSATLPSGVTNFGSATEASIYIKKIGKLTAQPGRELDSIYVVIP